MMSCRPSVDAASPRAEPRRRRAGPTAMMRPSTMTTVAVRMGLARRSCRGSWRPTIARRGRLAPGLRGRGIGHRRHSVATPRARRASGSQFLSSGRARFEVIELGIHADERRETAGRVAPQRLAAPDDAADAVPIERRPCGRRGHLVAAASARSARVPCGSSGDRQAGRPCDAQNCSNTICIETAARSRPA